MNRVTQITFTGFTDQPRQTETGISQGSPVSPILFLFFISGLLEILGQESSGQDRISPVGFVDDTNLITWGETAEGNCRRLEVAHEKCANWARQHGAKFAPEKYGLIHFTRKRGRDTQSEINIQGFHGKPIQEMRILGRNYSQIAEHLNSNRVPTKRGGRWHASTIRYIVRNDLYAEKAA